MNHLSCLSKKGSESRPVCTFSELKAFLRFFLSIDSFLEIFFEKVFNSRLYFSHARVDRFLKRLFCRLSNFPLRGKFRKRQSMRIALGG